MDGQARRLDPARAGVRPALVATPRGPVEYAEYGEGPAVLALHGAMGGWDQGLLLARTLAAGGHRFVGISRPGYLGNTWAPRSPPAGRRRSRPISTPPCSTRSGSATPP
jgi:hypothetical protein